MTILAVAVFGAIAVSYREKWQQAREDAEGLRAAIARVRAPGHEQARQVGWRRKRLLNRPEYHLLRDLEAMLRRAPNGHRLFAQVSYGAFLEATSRPDLAQTRNTAQHALNRKRADFLIIDRYGNPTVVVEYQGDGHYLGNAHDRDHAKRVACQRANIPLLEVAAAGLAPGQRMDLERRLGLDAPVAAE
jgi:hypothetical protein